VSLGILSVAPTPPPAYVGTTTRSPVSNSINAFLGPGPLDRTRTSTSLPRHLEAVSFVPT